MTTAHLERHKSTCRDRNANGARGDQADLSEILYNDSDDQSEFLSLAVNPDGMADLRQGLQRSKAPTDGA
jgi:hypothetical protein